MKEEKIQKWTPNQIKFKTECHSWKGQLDKASFLRVKDVLKLIDERINFLNERREECTIDGERHNNLDFKGFCIECEGRTFAVEELDKLKSKIKEKN